MRKWGIVISLLYALIVIGLLAPTGVLLVGHISLFSRSFYNELLNLYCEWIVWLLAALMIASQAALLFLSVDTSWKRLQPRTHVLVTGVIASLLFALLAFSAIISVDLAAKGPISDAVLDTATRAFAFCGGLWVLWGIVFFFYLRNSSAAVSRVLTWLLRGSVLELLIVVPSHVIVRRRDECCAPVYTSFGIVTGIAILLLSFGPGILLLYKKRLDAYRHRGEATAAQ